MLGLHVGHDATAALVAPDGTVAAAVAEERLTRIKFHTGFPYRAIDEVLRIAGVRPTDIGVVACATKRMFFPGAEELNRLLLSRNLDELRRYDPFNAPQLAQDPYALLWGLLKSNVRQLTGGRPDPGDAAAAAEDLTARRLRQAIEEAGLGHARIEVIEHHLAHAASAYLTAGVDRALVLTVDGAGDGLCATTSTAEGGLLSRVAAATADCSPGRFYSEVTRFLGFKRNRHEGKVTGLAAFGDPKRHYEALAQFLRFDPEREAFTSTARRDGPLTSKFKTVARVLKQENFGDPYIDEFFAYLKGSFDPVQDAKDLAAAAQAVLEDVCVAYAQHFLARLPSPNLLLAGGVFANVRVNQKLGELPGVRFVYVHQNMGDGGCALGAALLVAERAGQRAYAERPLETVYLGAGYDEGAVRAAIEAAGLRARRMADVPGDIAALLHAGKVVGRFDGRMEYGPRALGNRSILARPTERGINDWLNKRLARTEFMPFAPSALAEHASELFSGYDAGTAAHTARFMTITYDVAPGWRDRIQAATHVDGTARPQVVHREQNPGYHAIIQRYHQLSGIPAIINTSFNMHEEPIVATPGDAIRSFQQGALDYLAIGDYLCERP